MDAQVKVMERLGHLGARRAPTRRTGILGVVAAVVVASLAAATPALATCGAAPPTHFVTHLGGRSDYGPPITAAFFGDVRVIEPVDDYGRRHYLVRVQQQIAGTALIPPEADLSSKYICGDIELRKGVTYIFALTDPPADFDDSFVLENRNGQWISAAWSPYQEPVYLHPPNFKYGKIPAEQPADRVPTKLPALIRFLQRKLGPLPDTATEPVAAAVETLPLNPLLLVLAGAGGAFLGRRLKRDRDRARAHAV